MGMSTTSGEDVDTLIEEAKTILYSAAETKAEDSDKVVGALLDLEKLMRKKNKEDEKQMQQTVSIHLSCQYSACKSCRLMYSSYC